MLRYFFLLILALFDFSLIVKAHPNRTGSNGGYIDSGTSEYHYYNRHEVHSHYDIGDDGIRNCSYNSKNNKSRKASDNDSSQKTTNKTARDKGTNLAINAIFWGSLFVLTVIKESNDRKR